MLNKMLFFQDSLEEQSHSEYIFKASLLDWIMHCRCLRAEATENLVAAQAGSLDISAGSIHLALLT